MWDSAHIDPLGLAPQENQELTPEEQRAEHFREASRARYEYCVDMAIVFKGDKGKAVLKKWRENTIESSAWSPALAAQSGLAAANAHAYAREGQNAFVKDIEICIEIAHKCKTLDDFCAIINQAPQAS